jgi:5-methylcytosine-specific restriction endonuclease McrA
MESQNWRCCYCGTTIDLATGSVEHVIPRAYGGENHWDNKVAACRLCNASRGTMGADVYYRMVTSLGRLAAANEALNWQVKSGKRMGDRRRHLDAADLKVLTRSG